MRYPSCLLYPLVSGIVLVLTGLAVPVLAQDRETEFQDQRKIASELLHEGKIQQAIQVIEKTLSAASSDETKFRLHLDLLELCEQGYDWDCLLKALPETPKPPANAKNAIIQVLFYEVLLQDHFQDHKGITRTAELIAKARLTTPQSFNPAYMARIHLVLSSYYRKKRDLRASEHELSAAIANIVLIPEADVLSKYTIALDVIKEMTASQDLIGALALAVRLQPFFDRLTTTGPLYAEYRSAIASLTSALGGNRPFAIKELIEASDMLGRLEIDPRVKAYRLGLMNILATVLLALDDPTKAWEHHKRHPLNSDKEKLFEQDSFPDTGAFYFAVADIFLSTAKHTEPDQRWQKLFTTRPEWDTDEVDQAELDAYFDFALGLLQKNQELLIAAAKKRVAAFSAKLKTTAEGFPLPTILDRIVVAIGIAALADTQEQTDFDLILGGSEIINRGLRHHLADIATLLASQTDARRRTELRSFVHLVQSKRNWEVATVHALFAENKPQMENLLRYNNIVGMIEKLKLSLSREDDEDFGYAIPSLPRLQSSLKTDEAFVTHFDLGGKLGKLCVTHNSSVFTTTKLTPDDYAHLRSAIKLLQYAVTSDHPPDAKLDSQYPVDAAVHLRDILFGGLDICLAQVSNVSIALTPDFQGVPLGALLDAVPPRTSYGYDLAKANWLINRLSFSVSISARHFIASRIEAQKENSSRPFLGVGDPLLQSDGKLKLAATSLLRGSVPTANGLSDFRPLPETRQELETVGDVLGASSDDVILGADANEETFRAKPLAEYDVIHFATHGLIKEDIAGLHESALVLTPRNSDDSYDDGLLTASEISRLSINARLIVLSACNTAKYDVRQAGLEAEDLQAAFTIAGTPTLLASLWPIESVSAQQIVDSFFRNWRGGEEAAQALSLATRNFLAEADTAHQHPRFWAPFVVIGNGAMTGDRGGLESDGTRQSWIVLKDFESGGEILHLSRFGSDLLVGLIGEWDGERMNGIISRRRADGSEIWRVGSREIGLGPIATDGSDRIYVAGYGTKEPMPIVRSFNGSGELLWSRSFPELQGFNVFAIEPTTDRLFLLALPTSGSGKDGFLLSLKLDGTPLQKLTFDIGNIAAGRKAGLAFFDESLVILINSGVTSQLSFQKKTLEGAPAPCFSVSSTALYVEPNKLEVEHTVQIPNFGASALEGADGELLIGGEILDNCSPRGVAALIASANSDDLKTKVAGVYPYLWRDDSNFFSVVSGIAVEPKGIVVAVNQERTISAENSPKDLAMQAYAAANLKKDTPPEQLQHLLEEATKYEKRWADEPGTVREASFVRLSRNGSVLAREYLSAGMSVYLQGINTIPKSVEAYGTMGGLPAIARVTNVNSP